MLRWPIQARAHIPRILALMVKTSTTRLHRQHLRLGWRLLVYLYRYRSMILLFCEALLLPGGALDGLYLFPRSEGLWLPTPSRRRFFCLPKYRWHTRIVKID